MKKVILAFDGQHFSEGAMEFVRRLNEIKPLLATGVFLPQFQLLDVWAYTDSPAGPVMNPAIEIDEDDMVRENAERFAHFCQHNGIEYRIHKDLDDYSVSGLKSESLFADLLVIGAEVFYKGIGSSTPNEYLKETLHLAKCPILLVPEKFVFPESIILAYDGSEDSVFAIKQFSYLFPELNNLRTLLVYATEDKEEDFPGKVQMEELVARHFSDLVLFKLDDFPRKYFSTWLAEKNAALLVSGSYGRSGISQLFKRSFIKDVLADHQLPVFIAHK